MELFEKLAINKTRFDSPKGRISVEDLYDLPLQSRSNSDLDTVAKTIARKMRDLGEESFVASADPKLGELEFQLEVVKHVIAYKQDLNKARIEAAEKRERKELISEVLAEKEIDDLKALPTKELKKMLKKG